MNEAVESTSFPDRAIVWSIFLSEFVIFNQIDQIIRPELGVSYDTIVWESLQYIRRSIDIPSFGKTACSRIYSIPKNQLICINRRKTYYRYIMKTSSSELWGPEIHKVAQSEDIAGATSIHDELWTLFTH